MQITSINAKDNTAFGAKLKFASFSTTNKALRISDEPCKGFLNFSASELRSIERLFERRTKGVKGRLELREGGPYDTSKGNPLLYYSNNKSKYSDAFVYLDLKNSDSSDKVPKSVSEFADKLVDTFKALKNISLQAKKITKLENELEVLKTNRTNYALSEIGKNFKINF